MSAIFRLHVMSLLIITSIALISATQTNAEDNLEGKKLHNQHCLKCHDASVYQRPDRFIKSYEMLNQQIRRCEVPAGVQWSPSEITSVTDYLNSHYYKFEESK